MSSYFPSLKETIKIPSQSSSAASEDEISNQIGNTQPSAVEDISAFETPISNYDSPTTEKKQAEAIVKTSAQGNADRFSNLTPGKIDIATENGKVNVVDTATKKPISAVDTVTNQSVPSDVVNATVNKEDRTASFKVRLFVDASEIIILDAMPTIDESRSASYDPVNIIHHPGEILKYRSTSSRTWGIQTRLISRTPAEAAKNLKYINLIRSWVMPYHGLGTANALGQNQGSKLGAPPPIITLQGYGDKMIGPISCVLESYNWSWPNDVDYIKTAGDGVPFPVIVSISLSLKEALSPAEYSGFNIFAYREGLLGGDTGAFRSISNSVPPTSTSPPTDADVDRNNKSEAQSSGNVITPNDVSDAF